ncbi:MAG TPA: MFS transporter [Candidatus Limnocylindrales bacterium]|nr:MFS transporter [Candidatus Limnocylindrales bacterium]
MSFEINQGKQRAILLVMALSVLVVVMDLTILNVALASIQRELGASNADLQWSLDAYLITFAAFIFTGGVIADRFGRKRVLIGALVLFGLASVLAAEATSAWQLIVWRALMGVGAAAIPPVTLAILLTIFPPAMRPKAIGVWAGAAGVGTAVGPIIGGLLLNSFWWGSVLLINAPLAVLAIAAIVWLVPEATGPQAGSFDPVGVLLSIAGVGALVYGIVQGGEDSWLAMGTLGPILGGVILLAALVAFERRLAIPALDLSLLRASRYAAGTFAIAFAFFALLGAVFITSIYFQAVLGLAPANAGLLMVPMGLGALLTSTRVAPLVARYGARVVVSTGSAVMALSFLIFALVGRQSPIWVLALAQLILGLGWGSVFAPATGALMSVVQPAKAGAGQAVANTFRQVAGALGVAVIGSLLSMRFRATLGSAAEVLPDSLVAKARESLGGTLEALRAAGGQIPPAAAEGLKVQAQDAYVSGMHLTMLVCLAFALCAAIIALRGLPGKPPPATAAPAAPAAAPEAASR